MNSAAAWTTPFLARFAERAAALERRGPAWLGRLRRECRERFETLGLPTPEDEDWRDTNVAAIARTEFHPGTPRRLDPGDLPPLARLIPAAARIVVVDGRVAPELSARDGLPAGVWLGGLAEALEAAPDRLRDALARRAADELTAFRALAGALADDGAVVLVPDGVVVESPIHIVYLATAGDGPIAAHPRTVIVTGRSSQATVVETFTGPDGGEYLTNALTEVVVGPDATLDHCRLQLESESAFHVSTLESRQAAASQYRSLCIDFGGRLVRHDLTSVLDGDGASTQLDGLYLTRGDQHLDHHTVLDHARPRGSSREVYKGILAGRSRAVFHGRIVVREGAQKTDAKQSNPNLLLSDAALARTRPQLEIRADDVKCTHGATIGRLDEEALFYLRSRGIPRREARELIVRAFAGEVLERTRLAAVREFGTQEFGRRLAEIGG